MKKLVFASSLIFLMLIPMAVLAVGGVPVETQKWWQGILVVVIELVAALASPIIAVLAAALLRKMKINVEKEMLNSILDKAVGYGEQKLRVLLKEGKEPDYSGVKKDAVELGRKMLIQNGMANKWGGMLGDLIEAKLGQSKLEGPEAPKPEVKPVATPA